VQLLERARKAESEVITLRAQLKSETTMSKRQVRDMEATVVEYTARMQKSEREYSTLKDSIDGMKKTWKTDTDSLRAELNSKEETRRTETKEAAKSYRRLADELISTQTNEESIKAMRDDDSRIRNELEKEFRGEINALRAEMDRQSKDSNEAVDTARQVFVLITRSACSHTLSFTGGLRWN
jgi:hypothetical protein